VNGGPKRGKKRNKDQKKKRKTACRTGKPTLKKRKTSMKIERTQDQQRKEKKTIILKNKMRNLGAHRKGGDDAITERQKSGLGEGVKPGQGNISDSKRKGQAKPPYEGKREDPAKARQKSPLAVEELRNKK